MKSHYLTVGRMCHTTPIQNLSMAEFRENMKICLEANFRETYT